MSFLRELATYTKSFFSNWEESDASVPEKLRLTIRHRWRGVVTGKMCCGHPGEPGC